MNKLEILIYGILMVGFSLQSCSEFLTKDITESEFIIHSPADSLYSSASEITFWWDENTDVESFRLQIVSPGFDQPVSIFDTMSQGGILSLLTEEGRYEWRIRGENEGSVSPYQSRSFVIDQTPPEKSQRIFPIDTLDSGIDTQMLSWESKDILINGVRSSVSDSLYLMDNANQILFREHIMDENDKKTISIESLNLSKNQTYRWHIVSIDQAGQITKGDTNSFWLK